MDDMGILDPAGTPKQKQMLSLIKYSSRNKNQIRALRIVINEVQTPIYIYIYGHIYIYIYITLWYFSPPISGVYGPLTTAWFLGPF